MKGLGRWQPTLEYMLIDVHRWLPEGPREWNEANVLIQLVVSDPEDWDGILAELSPRLGKRGDALLRR